MSARVRSKALTPVLLLGAGRGEATCGILYLASYLRRNGIEAFVRLYDADETEDELERSLAGLLKHVRPKVVGVSLKWFNHVSRALVMLKLLKRIDPEVRVVVGGNSASYWWRELARFDFIDDVVLGDGELPLLSLCRGDEHPPNLVTRNAAGAPRRLPLKYVQSVSSRDVYYSHFEELFLSQQDRHAFSGWIAPGKGCSENCVYCGGGRGVQQASFGRAESFLRPVEAVRKDHLEIAPLTWQLRYDFSGGTADFLGRAWKGVNLKRHACTYFLWGVPPKSLVDALAANFERVYLVLDIGCFSELQRAELIRRGLLKPCPTDAELFETVRHCAAHPNLKLEVSGIGGLPFTTDATLAQELPLAERLLELGCDVGSQRLECQPGALVTEHPDRFGMVAEARSFADYVAWFGARGHLTDGAFPMITFKDAKLEAAVERTAGRLQERIQQRAEAKAEVLDGRTRLVAQGTTRTEVPLAEWLGRHRVPEGVAREPVTVVRSLDGAGLACTPSLSPRRFADPQLQQGADATAILAVLQAFAKPATVESAVSRLRAKHKLDPRHAREVVEGLAAGGFLRGA